MYTLRFSYAASLAASTSALSLICTTTKQLWEGRIYRIIGVGTVAVFFCTENPDTATCTHSLRELRDIALDRTVASDEPLDSCSINLIASD